MNAMDYIVLFGLLSFCGFITYTVNEIANAIHSMMNG
jgi:hypothetical protein